MKLRKYTAEELRLAVSDSYSLRQTLIKLGVAPFGGNYDVLRRAIEFYNLDTDHFTGQAWNRGKSARPRVELSQYLRKNSAIQSNKLRLRLLKAGVFAHCCSSCDLTHWKGQAIPLELDHINGDNRDNRLSNLRLLCPNYHAQTPTYRGRRKTRA